MKLFELGFLSNYKVEKWSVNGKVDSTVVGSAFRWRLEVNPEMPD
jgi:hypothetical protein